MEFSIELVFYFVLSHDPSDEGVSDLGIDDRLQDWEDKQGFYLDNKEFDFLWVVLSQVND